MVYSILHTKGGLLKYNIKMIKRLIIKMIKNNSQNSKKNTHSQNDKID